MENKLLYPAVFHHVEEGGFWITFPDFPEAVSEKDDLNDAYLMACDCLNTILSYRINSKAIKKTLSIPSWLNEEAMAKNINFSLVLQEALLEKIKL